MATEFKLSYTASEINERLGKVDTISEEIADLKVGVDKATITEAVNTYLDENPVQAGVTTTTQSNSLWMILQKMAFTEALTDAELTAFKTAWNIESSDTEPEEPEITLSSISATYSGGDVAVGTDVTALTGIVVTAHYSDGSSATVTDYTLSGTIAEGNNTITVSYGGNVTSFTVVGIAGEPEEPTVNGYTVNPVSEWSFVPGKTNRVTTAFTLLEGDRVNFVNADLWNTYKYAIGLGGYHVDIQYIGGGYQEGELTIESSGIYTVMVTRQDNATIGDAEMAVIANSIGYIKGSSTDVFQTETITDYDTLQGYPSTKIGQAFTEATGTTTIYFAVNPGDYYEVSRNGVSTNDRFRFAFAATEPQNDIVTMAYINCDGQVKSFALAPDGANYLMVYVGGTSYPTIPDGFTITRKYKV